MPDAGQPSLFGGELAKELERLEAARLRRRLEHGEASGRVDFRSNDYLGLAHHPEVVEAARRTLAESGVGAGAARLLGGGRSEHARLERSVADWLGTEASLLFPSGYQANLGVVGALVTRGDAVFSDRLNHASLVDAARLSRARVFVHGHLDLDELDRQLAAAAPARRRLVLTEGVFSMDGDRPPLGELHELAARRNAWLVVDEAHAAGVVGPEGAGAWAELDLPPRANRLAARIVTGGKALGVGGALVSGSRELCELLLHRARSFVFTTAPPPALAAALSAALELARRADPERVHLRELARELARRLELPEPAAAIVPVPLGSEERALEQGEALRRAGFDVGAVRPPTVARGGSRLRVVCHAGNTAAQVDELARRLAPAAPFPADARAPTGSRSPSLAPALFVVGTDTGVGKTVVSALLLRAARRLGNARYWKPVQTGAESDTEAVATLAGAARSELLRPAWELPLPASPHTAAAEAGVTLRLGDLEASLGGLRRTLYDCTLIVELAGGLLVPYDGETTQADWLERAALPLVLVARSGLGTLNHTLLSLEALRARHLEPRALFLVGAAHQANRETLRERSGVPAIYELAHLPALDTSALDGWLDAHDLAPVFEGGR